MSVYAQTYDLLLQTDLMYTVRLNRIFSSSLKLLWMFYLSIYPSQFDPNHFHP